MEVWKDVIDNDIYQVSSKGNIRSKERYTKGRYGLILRKTKIIKPQLRERYLAVGMYKDGKFNSKSIHRLVAIHFVPNPDNKPEVNHKDGDKFNNNYWNLEWNTSLENVTHAIKNRLRKMTGEEHPRAILNNKDIVDIRENKLNLTQKELGLIYGVTHYTINKIVVRKQWAHIK